MINEKNLLGTVVFVGLLILLSGALSGCGVKFDLMYYGQTPVGLDNRQATQIAAPVRLVKARAERERNDD